MAKNVVLSNASSSWNSVTVGIPRGSYLGPLLFINILTTFLMILNPLKDSLLTILDSMYSASMKSCQIVNQTKVNLS